MAHTQSRMRKEVKDMSLEEQIEALGDEPMFRDLLREVQQLSPDRQDALASELDSLGDRL